MPKPSTPDFDALLDGIAAGGGPQQKMLAILEAIGPDQAAKVTAAAKARKPGGGWVHSSRRIALALTNMGHEISEGAVNNWRVNLR